jgi:hypothetical protein
VVKACEPHDREPRFEVMQFEDDEAVKAFVADKSEHRNLTKGQQAMRLALLYPEPEKGGRGNKGKALETSGFSRQRLGQARSVLAFSRELALAVRDGSKKLDALALGVVPGSSTAAICSGLPPATVNRHPLAHMGTKSRETIYGASVRAAAGRATEARKQADRLAVEAWNKRMLGFQGPAQPSPAPGDALNAGYRYLEVKRLGCNTHQTVALDIVRRPKTTPIHELERYMRCRQCSEVRRYPYKRSHLVALRPTKISTDDPAVDMVARRAITNANNVARC